MSFDEEAAISGDHDTESLPLIPKTTSRRGISKTISNIYDSTNDQDIPENGGGDVVQFSAPMYFASEDDEVVKIEVIRMGTMKGRVAVRCITKDASAKGQGVDYESFSQQLVFEEGEHTKNIEIKVFDSTEGLWSPTIEFKVKLSHPQNCKLGAYLDKVRVKIFNTDPFPSDLVGDDVQKDEEGIRSIPDWQLFREYCRLNFDSSGCRWQTILILVLDQLSNVFLFVSLCVGVYIVDTIFARSSHFATSSQRLLVADRYQTAVIIALWFVVPNVILYAWDYAKAHIDVKGASRSFLQVSLMQAYLDYTNESRCRVTTVEISHAIAENAVEVSHGYVAVLNIVGLIGKLITIEVFIILFQPDPFAIGAAFFLVLVLVIAAIVRTRVSQQAQERAEEEQGVCDMIVDEASRKYNLIYNYSKRSVINDMFKKAVKRYAKQKIPVEVASMNTHFIAKFLSGVFVALYIVLKTPAVLNNELSLGIFLATISILTSDLANTIADLNNQLVQIVETFVPLKEITLYLNLPSSLSATKQIFQEQRDETNLQRLSIFAESEQHEAAFKTDLIKIAVRDVTFERTPDAPVFKNVNISLSQGQMVAVTGPHKAGRTIFMELLAHHLCPKSGIIFVPPHLRILYIARSPTFLRASMLSNLCLGLPSNESVDLDRIYAILKLCGVAEIVDLVKNEVRLMDDKDDSLVNKGISFDDSYQGLLTLESLTQSQKIRLHIARALIENPDVLILSHSLEGLHHDVAVQILDVLRDHVTNRGVCMVEGSFGSRRPRNVFFGTVNKDQAARADTILEMDPENKTIVERSTVADST